MGYHKAGELLVVIEQFLLDVLEGRFAFIVKHLFFFVLGNLVHVVISHFLFVGLVLFEDAAENFDLDVECFFS